MGGEEGGEGMMRLDDGIDMDRNLEQIEQTLCGT